MQYNLFNISILISMEEDSDKNVLSGVAQLPDSCPAYPKP